MPPKRNTIRQTIAQLNRALHRGRPMESWAEYYGFRQMFNHVDRSLTQEQRTRFTELLGWAEENLSSRLGAMPVFDDSIHVLPGYERPSRREAIINELRHRRRGAWKGPPTATGMKQERQLTEVHHASLLRRREELQSRIRNVRSIDVEHQVRQLGPLYAELNNLDSEIQDYEDELERFEVDPTYGDPLFVPRPPPDDDEPPPNAIFV